MNQQEILRARDFLLRREQREKLKLDELYRTAVQDFANILAMIIHDYDPIRVYQWGSLIHRENFREYSDIDIAVEGIGSAEIFFQILGKAQDLTQFPVDLVEIEKIDPLHRQSILKKGKKVYEDPRPVS